MKTFASRVLEYYTRLQPPNLRGLGVDALLPLRDREVLEVTETFYRTFFDDSRDRTYLIGINPGRFGGGVTGVPFTDPVSLERLGIPNAFSKRRELSAEFVEMLLERMGGAREFYRSHFIGAVSPIGFTRGGTNYNYYDDPRLLTRIKPFIVSGMHAQLAFGARRIHAIVLGTGKNYAFFNALNAEHRFFETVTPIEHPRFIMQYRRKQVPRFLDKYESLLSTAR